MKKIKNTTQNKLVVLASLVAIGSGVGFALSRKDKSMTKLFVIAGGIIGLASWSGISSWIIEPKDNQPKL